MSDKVRAAFYKSKFGDGHWLDNGISAWTWLISSKNREVGPYSHVEIWEPDKDGGFVNDRSACWTSTTRGEVNGTVVRPAFKVIMNRDRWDIIEVEAPNWYQMQEYMQNEVDNNKGYAKRDCGKFFGLGFLADPNRNICSEFCNNALYFRGVLEQMGVVSPRRLAWLLVQAGYEIKPLTELI